MTERYIPNGDKEWPEGNETVAHQDLVMPLRIALEYLYELRPRIDTGDVPYDGYNIGKRERAQSFSPSERLTTEQLDESEDNDSDRDPATEIISLAVQLGMEQGRRLEAQARAEQSE
ncbi:MAG TPA: hypothetical protein VMR95_00500 [Candidatus Binatia bacterium]|nr:hypothetical protein [Candidatus Binatia bacterium]